MSDDDNDVAKPKVVRFPAVAVTLDKVGDVTTSVVDDVVCKLLLLVEVLVVVLVVLVVVLLDVARQFALTA